MYSFSPQILQDEVNHYSKDLYNFLTTHHLLSFLSDSIDHVAIKAKDAKAFEDLLHEVDPYCTKLTFTELQNRRIATAILSTPISLPNFGTTNYLEIMEPRPERIGYDVVGLEHSEIYQPNHSAIEKILQENQIPYRKQYNSYHKTIVLIINKNNQEIKFTDTRLADVLQEEEKNNKLTSIK